MFLRTAQKRLFENDFSSFVFNANEKEQQVQSFIDVLAGQRCRGLIYLPETGADSVVLHGNPTLFVERRRAFETDVSHVQLDYLMKAAAGKNLWRSMAHEKGVS